MGFSFMGNFFKEAFSYKESQCSIISDTAVGIQVAKESLKKNRTMLEEYANANPKFVWTLKPFSVPEEPLVAKLMAEAGQKAGVGPMAAVAGVLADLAVREMVNVGCKVAVVEDGGEVSAVSSVPIDVGLLAGDELLSRRLGFRLTEFPCGVATSSGRFSHALSFGDAEAVTIFCGEAGLADAAATAVCNFVKGDDAIVAIEKGLCAAKLISGVEGVLILFKQQVGTWGKIPQIVKLNPTSEANFTTC
jgi:uncharacterized protein